MSAAATGDNERTVRRSLAGAANAAPDAEPPAGDPNGPPAEPHYVGEVHPPAEPRLSEVITDDDIDELRTPARTTTPYSPRRRELTWPKLDPADRPDAQELAEQRRLANPRRSSRAKPRTVTTKEETK